MRWFVIIVAVIGMHLGLTDAQGQAEGRSSRRFLLQSSNVSSGPHSKFCAGGFGRAGACNAMH